VTVTPAAGRPPSAHPEGRRTRSAVLCVDDEPSILRALRLTLGRKFAVSTAESGREGLDVLRTNGTVAVVVSDMRMPEMNGATFLQHVHEEFPDTVRILLTGETDLQAAIAAVNQGQIFRFLTKPCPPPVLLATVQAGAEQHRLLTAERVLLEQTLRGSIQVLIDVLALSNPVAFGRADRIRQLAVALATEAGVADTWQIDVAAMLSHIGHVTLPPATAGKLYRGEALTETERTMVDGMPEAVERLLGHIPRLDPFLSILRDVGRPFRPGTSPRQAPSRAARVLRIAIDFDGALTRGVAAQTAIDRMRATDTYDPELLDCLTAIRGNREAHRDVVELPIRAVTPGMVFARDVLTSDGVLFAAEGYEVTQSFVERAGNLERGYLREPVVVIVPKDDTTELTPTTAEAVES